jgi:hypothetical protein
MISNNAFGPEPKSECPQSESEHALHAVLIDRLASGDLDASQQLDLLAWLDEQPARWRRCGLAFLEAQALRESFATVGVTRGSSRRTQTLSTLVAAAALLLAFVLGWSGGGRGGQRPEIAGPGESPDSRYGATDPSPFAADKPGRERQDEDATAGTITLVQLRVGEGSSARQLIVPVNESDLAHETWQYAPSSIPEYLRQRWEQQGYRITEERRSIPLKLTDGRQVTLPIDRVMLTYVGQPSL